MFGFILLVLKNKDVYMFSMLKVVLVQSLQYFITKKIDEATDNKKIRIKKMKKMIELTKKPSLKKMAKM